MDGTVMYLAYQKVVELAQEAGVLYAMPLFISKNGGFGESLAFNPRFATKVPEQLGL